MELRVSSSGDVAIRFFDFSKRKRFPDRPLSVSGEDETAGTNVFNNLKIQDVFLHCDGESFIRYVARNYQIEPATHGVGVCTVRLTPECLHDGSWKIISVEGAIKEKMWFVEPPGGTLAFREFRDVPSEGTPYILVSYPYKEKKYDFEISTLTPEWIAKRTKKYEVRESTLDK